jgi:hypothetical protein
MHKNPRNFAKALTALLLSTVLLSSISLSIGSTGNIHIDSLTSPSPHVTIALGGNVSLYFGDVTWSGGQVNLYLSADGYASISDDDTPYGPTFSVNDIQTNASKAVDGYTVGYNWINGTVPTTLGVPGGNYYVKAFDGSTAAVAVTDTYFTIEASFEVVPTFGPGQAAIELKGYALPENGHANFSYNAGAGWVTIANLVGADAVGNVVYSMIAPDLLMALPSGLNAETFSIITFQMIVDETGQTEQATFDEYWRGLKQVMGETGVTAPSGQLYGNNTDLSGSVDAKVLGDLILAGYWFHPGNLTILWDGQISLGTTAANMTHGFFNTTVTVPITSLGTHNVTIDDGKMTFVVYINVIPTLILDPTEGPVGTVVTATGYGFPESDGIIINVTLWWDYTCYCWDCEPVPLNLTVIPTNTNGHFVTTFVVPTTVGGIHIVWTETDGPINVYADASFDVLPTLTVTPGSIVNDGSMLVVSGTGLDNPYHYEGDFWYDLCIDYEKDIEFIPDCNGDWELEIIVSASFEPGVHVIALYMLEPIYYYYGFDRTLVTYVLFNVTSAEEELIMGKLDEIQVAITALDEFVRDQPAAVAALLEAISSDLSSARSAILTEISTIGSQLTSIESYAQNAATKATEAATSASTAATAANAAKTAAEAAQSANSGITTYLMGTIVLALVAALASIVVLVMLQRKVA